jgi:hypothetical protein
VNESAQVKISRPLLIQIAQELLLFLAHSEIYCYFRTEILLFILYFPKLRKFHIKQSLDAIHSKSNHSINFLLKKNSLKNVSTGLNHKHGSWICCDVEKEYFTQQAIFVIKHGSWIINLDMFNYVAS